MVSGTPTTVRTRGSPWRRSPLTAAGSETPRRLLADSAPTPLDWSGRQHFIRPVRRSFGGGVGVG